MPPKVLLYEIKADCGQICTKMINKNNLHKIHVVVADADRKMADVLVAVLRQLGLSKVTLVKNGRQALEIIKTGTVDLLVTEWEMEPMSGVNLIKTLRFSDDPYFALLPIIMLTARARREDVTAARDMGVTEFLVKPYTPGTLFSRLEHVIDFPRDLIIYEHYTGPDRRRIDRKPKQEQREHDPETLPLPKKLEKAGKPAIRILSRSEIRKKAKITQALNKVITTKMLQEAQEAINEFTGEALEWIKQDMNDLQDASKRIIEEHNERLIPTIKTSLLSIRSRAGTFGFSVASQVAFDLYNFIEDSFLMENDRHHVVVDKYTEGLKVILARQITNDMSDAEIQLIQGLEELKSALA